MRVSEKLQNYHFGVEHAFNGFIGILDICQLVKVSYLANRPP